MLFFIMMSVTNKPFMLSMVMIHVVKPVKPVLNVVKLGVMKLSVAMLNGIIIGAILLSGVMIRVLRLNVVMLNCKASLY
jgi:hypothetical protein